MRAAIACLVILWSLAAPGQTANRQPSFDVASIKAAPPPEPGRGMFVGMHGGPGTNDPGLFTCNNCDLMGLITLAYDVQRYQVSGASPENSTRFNISARVPEGTTKEQFRLMLQNLLADRFKLAIHRETKEGQVYDLVVAKNGHKLKESSGEALDPLKDGPPPPPPGGRGGPPIGKDGYPVLPPRCNGCMAIINGKARAQYVNETMEVFAQRLSGQLGKPVHDATDLKGRYDFTLTYDMSAMGGMMMGRGGPPSLPPGAEPSGQANSPLASADNDSGETIFSAVQSQLGLRLEQKKGSVDLIVVEHIEKVPTEN